jgi:hypothetical protein
MAVALDTAVAWQLALVTRVPVLPELHEDIAGMAERVSIPVARTRAAAKCARDMAVA